MSKKKFTDGLDSLFGLSTDNLTEDSPLLVNTAEKPQPKPKVRKRRNALSKPTGKSFTSDLDSLFKSAISESVAEQKKEQNEIQTLRQERARRLVRRKKRVTGLDSLLRQTIDASSVNIETKTKKRVTFVVDKMKLTQLKAIARTEKSYLKDIIGEIVSEFLDKYKSENGSLPEISYKS